MKQFKKQRNGVKEFIVTLEDSLIKLIIHFVQIISWLGEKDDYRGGTRILGAHGQDRESAGAPLT